MASDVATQIPPDAQWLVLHAPAYREEKVTTNKIGLSDFKNIPKEI